MVKKIKFSLDMGNGVKVRSLEQLQDNFNIEKALEYYSDGKLLQWLKDRNNTDIADTITVLSQDDADFIKKFCEALGVPYTPAAAQVEPEELALRRERLNKLKQITADEDIIRNLNSVAFNQEELAELFDADCKKIYLCEGRFRIPEAKMNLEYIKVGGAEIVNIPKKPDVCETAADKEVENPVNKSIEALLTDEIKNAKSFIYNKNRVIFSNASYSNLDTIHMITLDGKQSEISTLETANIINFIYLDDEKVVWAYGKSTPYYKPPFLVRYFDMEQVRVVVDLSDCGVECAKENVIIRGDYLFYKKSRSRIYKVNMRTGDKSSSTHDYIAIHLFDGCIIGISAPSAHETSDFYKIDPDTFHEEIICQVNGGEAVEFKFFKSNLVWFCKQPSSLFGFRSFDLYGYNLNTHKLIRLDTIDSLSNYSGHIHLDNSGVYFTVENNGQIKSITKIGYDGKGKTKLNRLPDLPCIEKEKASFVKR